MAKKPSHHPSILRNRQEAIREEYDMVLIVCEGSETEPNYFKRLRNHYKLSTVNINIAPATESDPVSVVNSAKKEAEKAKEPYDRVFCVYDLVGSQKEKYDQAMSLIKASDGQIKAITSHPCFEVWVLLHFTYSTASFDKAGKSSACGNVIKEIEDKHIPSYNKGDPTLFDELHSRMDKAIENAKKLEKYNQETGSENPGTNLHHLVDYLRKLKSMNYNAFS
ncbi:MAG: RloB family protein [Alphaproteobacteria bacterium]